MTNISTLEMAEAIERHPHTVVKSGFLGFGKTVYYQPTMSKLQVKRVFISNDSAEKLKKLFDKPVDNLALIIKEMSMTTCNSGSQRADICYADDQKFAAVQLYAYEDYRYRPKTDIIIYENDNAQHLLNLFSSK